VTEGEAGQRSLVDQLLDVVVFLPLGAALAAQSDPSGLAERGRRHFESQVRTARFLGELAVRQAGRQVGSVSADLWKGFRSARHHEEPSSPTAPATEPPAPNAADDEVAPPATSTNRGGRPGRVAVGELAIPGYDQLSAFQVVQRLGGLDVSELEQVLEYEQSHRRRKTVVSRVEQLLQAARGGQAGSGRE